MSYLDQSAISGGTYTYRVLARQGRSLHSDLEVSIVLPPYADTARTATAAADYDPRNFSVSRGRGGVLLSWSAPTGRINGYKLLRQRTHLDETSFSALSTDYNDSDGPAATTYIDRDATGDGAYVYKVESIDADGNMLGTTSTLTVVIGPVRSQLQGVANTATASPTASSTATETPTSAATATETATPSLTPSSTATAETVSDYAPRNLQASKGDNGISLTWDEPVESVSGFTVNRKRTHLNETDFTAVISFLSVGDVPLTTDFVDTSATDEGTYIYGVDAVDGDISVVGSSAEVTVNVGPIEQSQSQQQVVANTATASPTASSTATETATLTPIPTATDTAGPSAPEPCSLADKIRAANTDRASGACPAGRGADRITLTGDIVLSQALPAITSDITINGAGYSISGDDAHRIFEVVYSGALTLENITLKDGLADSGGAIYNTGTLTIRRSTLRDNVATFWGGALTNGIGLLTVESSSFIGNSALTGGAIFSNGIEVSIVNSTFSANIASNYGGGIDVQGGTVTIVNSTLYDNGSGGLNQDSGTLKLRNSIIAGSTGADCQGSLAENSSNYIEDDSCSPTMSSADGAINLGELTGSPAYHPLLEGSAAIDAGNASHCPTSDQLGTARPVGEGCDLGAQERTESLQISLQQEVVDEEATPTETATYTVTATNTATDTPSPTDTPTDTPSPTLTPTASPTNTATLTATNTATLAPREGCVNVGPGTYWLFPANNFLSGTITVYASDQCEAAGSSTRAIGADGYVVTALGEAAAQAMCAAAHADEREFTARQQAFNLNLYLCVGVAPTNTATLTATNTATLAPREGCVNVGPGTYWLFPASNFLSGTITVYASDQCEAAGSSTQAIGADGYVVTALGEAAAQAMCAAAHADEREFTARQQAFNLNLYLCVGVAPTNTAIPPSNTPITPTATNTLIPPTNTAIPQTLSDPRAIAGVRLSSVNPGELSVEWDAPGESAHDYRVSWAKVGEPFRTWADLDYNAFPTSDSLTISGLEGGARYKVKLRARYDGAAGSWTGAVEATVMETESLPQLDLVVPPSDTPTNTAVPPTNTAIPPTNTTIPPTNTLVPPTNTAVPPTNTPASNVGPREIEFVVLNGDPNGAYDVSWPVPSDYPVDYRINWAAESDGYPSWTDSSGNAFPAVNAYTIAGLELDVCYKVRVRARYNGRAGDWIEVKGKINGSC